MSAGSLADLLDRQAAAHGGRNCLSFGDGTTVTYAELADRVAKARGALAAAGVRPGTRVGLMLQNSLFYPTAWLAVVTLGATAVPVNKRLGPEDAGFVVGHSGTELLVCDEAAEPVATQAAATADRSPAVLTVATGDHLPEPVRSAAPAPAAACTPRTLANVQYTSGTTGFPKGCLLTHGYWTRLGAWAAGGLRLAPGRRLLTAQPFSYMDPFWNVTASLHAGAHLVVLDGFHPSTFMRDVAAWGVTSFYCLGVMPSLLLKQPPDPSDRGHALERVLCSAIPPQLHEAIEARWGVPWYETFGMTETGVNVAMPDEDHDRTVGTGCIGRPVEHCEVSVVDGDGFDVPPGAKGELRVRGLGLMEGYLDDPDATARFFRSGWAHTGDLAVVDAEGLVYYRGRIKETVRRGGENISQAEVEFALRAHPDVLDCAVAPVPDAVMGEEAKAYVVPLPGRAVDPAALRAWLLGRLAPFKVPRYWELRDDLPRTPSERIAKPQLEAGRPSWRAGTWDAAAG